MDVTSLGVRLQRAAVLSAALVAVSGYLWGAERVELEGISFRLPEGWVLKDRDSSDQLLQVRRAGLIAEWQENDAIAGNANLSLSVNSGYLRISESEIPGVRQQLEAGTNAHDSIEGFEVRDIRVTRVDGLAAYRIRLRVNSPLYNAEQLIYVIQGATTYSLLFSCEASEYDNKESEFEATVQSVNVAKRPTLLQTTPMWIWTSTVGMIIALALVAWRRPVKRPSTLKSIAASSGP